MGLLKRAVKDQVEGLEWKKSVAMETNWNIERSPMMRGWLEGMGRSGLREASEEDQQDLGAGCVWAGRERSKHGFCAA